MSDHNATSSCENDPTVIDWDGEDDCENPQNWPLSRKWAALSVVGGMTFISPLTSTLFAPAAPFIAEEFGITNSAIISFVVSAFILGYAVGPLLASPISELYGRNVSLQVFMIIFFIFNIACAISQSTTQIIVFRFLAGCGGSAPLAVGIGAVTDCFKRKDRGSAMGMFNFGVLLGPIIGPIAGAWLVSEVNWRWAIWMVVILSGLLSMLSFFLLRETYHPTLLARKARRIAKETRRTAISVHQASAIGRTPSMLLKENLSRPFILLFTDPICAIMGLYSAICVGYLYLVFVTFGNIFVSEYHQSVGISTLHYIAPGLGSLVGSTIYATIADKVYDALTARNGGEEKPEYRVPVMFVAALLVPIGLIIYGWTAQYHLHWILPDIGIFIFSIGTIISFISISMYIADTFKYAASASAAASVLRSLAGGVFPLFARDILKSMGIGWSNTLLALISLVLGFIYPTLLWFYGPRLRASAKTESKTSH